MKDCPQEVLYAIAAAVSFASQPSSESSLDPLYATSLALASPTASPSSFPPSQWPEATSRETLANLCLVSQAWNEAARPYLWHRLHVRLPRSWLAMLEEIAGDDPEEIESDQETSVDALAPPPAAKTSPRIRSASLGPSAFSPRRRFIDNDEAVHDSILATLSRSELPVSAIPVDLLSPPASRDPSPGRLRASSPGRWRFIRAVNHTVHNAEPGLYIPTPHEPSPGRHVRHLDFNHFRTVGMRRYIGEGVHRRFVTESRLERVLKEMPNLLSFGATEFMDSAISQGVLEELILRGSAAGDIPNRRGRGSTAHDDPISETSNMDEDTERRAEYKAVEALDFCGCVSSVFLESLKLFVDTNVRCKEGTFPGLKRLGLRGVTSVPSDVLSAFVAAFPSLTHLDLAGTRCSPELLEALGASSVELTHLSLSRCPRLTGESIVAFLVHGGRASSGITQLALYGDMTYPSPLNEANLTDIVENAPCFTSGLLEYLDLSSTPITPTLLASASTKPQPRLRSLGLSYIPSLPISAITNFILTRAPAVEILSLVGTSPELVSAVRSVNISLALHSKLIRPLCTPPFYFSSSSEPDEVPKPGPPTRLRVIELKTNTLAALGAGAGAWKIVKSKGGRAWYVDSASGWDGGVLKRDLVPEHPVRKEITRLAACDGNVDSSIGWHARKMEVLNGQGLLGRENGLYGAVSFAYVG